MARVPMVTRTIVTTKCNVMFLDVEQGEPFNKVVVLPRTYKDDKSMLRAVVKAYETDTTKAVHIVDHEEVETMYGMAEQKFIDNAVILNPETRKPIEE